MTPSQKHQNPREGIETQQPATGGLAERARNLRNTRIPARGLKLPASWNQYITQTMPQKHQNPREGIETQKPLVGFLSGQDAALRNTRIPARGLKHIELAAGEGIWFELRNTRIPARGLKRG